MSFINSRLLEKVEDNINDSCVSEDDIPNEN